MEAFSHTNDEWHWKADGNRHVIQINQMFDISWWIFLIKNYVLPQKYMTNGRPAGLYLILIQPPPVGSHLIA